MMFFINKYKLFIAGAILAIIITAFSILSFLPSSPPTNQQITPTPPDQIPTSQKISPLQKNIIGQKPETDLSSLSGFLGKQTLPNGQERYIFESEISTRPNEVVTDSGVVVFEKELVPENPGMQGYTLLSQIKSSYGEAERTIKGSKFYGPFLNQYVYASRGFAVIANPNNDEVYEISFFEPTSVERYISRYADDITSQNQPVRE